MFCRARGGEVKAKPFRDQGALSYAENICQTEKGGPAGRWAAGSYYIP
jgi:hypothetical protein